MNLEMEAIVAGIRLLVCLSIGWIIYFWGYRKYRTDLLRYKLFILRDSLFRTTYNMGIPFDSPAYVAVRDVLNGLLRHAHRVNLGGLLIVYWWKDKVPQKEVEDLEGVFAAINDEKYKKVIIDTCERIIKELFWHILKGAPILFLYLVFKFCAALTQESRKAFKFNIQSLQRLVWETHVRYAAVLTAWIFKTSPTHKHLGG